jgi:hypothetical protein
MICRSTTTDTFKQFFGGAFMSFMAVAYSESYFFFHFSFALGMPMALYKSH